MTRASPEKRVRAGSPRGACSTPKHGRARDGRDLDAEDEVRERLGGARRRARSSPPRPSATRRRAAPSPVEQADELERARPDPTRPSPSRRAAARAPPPPPAATLLPVARDDLAGGTVGGDAARARARSRGGSARRRGRGRGTRRRASCRRARTPRTSRARGGRRPRRRRRAPRPRAARPGRCGPRSRSPRRTAIPEEYVLTGASRNSSTPANRTIVVEARGDLPLRQAEQQAGDLDVLASRDLRDGIRRRARAARPDARGPRPSLDVGRTIPERSFRSVDLPEPFAPTTPSVSPARDREGDVRRAPTTPPSAGSRPRAAAETDADFSVPCALRA